MGRSDRVWWRTGQCYCYSGGNLIVRLSLRRKSDVQVKEVSRRVSVFSTTLLCPMCSWYAPWQLDRLIYTISIYHPYWTVLERNVSTFDKMQSWHVLHCPLTLQCIKSIISLLQISTVKLWHFTELSLTKARLRFIGFYYIEIDK